ncbi:MAG: HD domain-containing protein [Candidatus Gracilibacteria bacterium]|nr:HD domain-containing protein [Candidatus Gracilibacteria bacterium]
MGVEKINGLEINIDLFNDNIKKVINSDLIRNIIVYVNNLLGPLEFHYYHHYEHTLEVMYRALYIGQEENLSIDDIEILAIASLFHDTGFVIEYDNNEPIGAKIAKNYLNSILYPKEKIDKIEKMILATIVVRQPENLLESIIKDADTDNLGRKDFFDKGSRLKKELETIKNIKILNPDWYHYSLKFVKKHKFYSNSEIKEREETKENNIYKLQELTK